MRRLAEAAFETKTGGQNLVQYLMQQKNEGKSLRAIADQLSATIGMRVSYETVRRWMLDG